MIDDRAVLGEEWLRAQPLKGIEKITPLAQDASFRRYFRIKTKEKNLILVDAPPALENMESYVAITEAYRAAQIHTPQVFYQDLTLGFLLIEDFGDRLLSLVLNEQNAFELYRKCYAVLPRIQACQDIPSLGALPHFVDHLLMTELKNFHEWCLIKFAGLTLSVQEEYMLAELFSALQQVGEAQPQVGVHRDYHSRNLMLLPDDEIGVLDFQDAVIGPVTYDLVSLLRDCYVSWPKEQVEKNLKDYYEHFNTCAISSFEQFFEWFDWQGLQRHLKAIFIFCRKYLRDGSAAYLNDIIRTMDYVAYVAAHYPALKEFRIFFEERMKPSVLEKIRAIR